MSNYQLFLLDFGLSSLQISILIATAFIVIFIFEIPTGAYADLIGRKNSFLFSCILSLIAMLMYYWGNHFFIFVLAEIIAGIGFTFSSGSIDAWVVDKLENINHKDKIRNTFIDLSIYGNLANLFSGFIGAFIATQSLRLPRLMGAIGLTITFVVALIFIDDKDHERSEMSLQNGMKNIVQVSKDSIKIGINNKPFRILLISGSIVALCVSASVLWQTYFNKNFNLDTQVYGFLWVLISLSNIFGGFILKLLKKWDKHIITFISIIGYGLAMLLVTSFSQQIYAFGFFMLAKTSISFFVPTQMTLVNECINEKYRATTLSFYSMTTELVGGIGILFVGFMSKTWSISTSWRVFAILALFSILIYSTIISNNNSKKLEG